MRKLLALLLVLLALPVSAQNISTGTGETSGSGTGIAITHATGACGTCTESASVEWRKSSSNWYSATFVYTVSALGNGTGGIIGFALPNSSTASTRGASCVGQAGPGTYTTGGYMAASSPSQAWINIATLAQATYVLSCTYLSAT